MILKEIIIIGSHFLGRDREKLSLALATEFSFQELYEELQERIEVLKHDLVY